MTKKIKYVIPLIPLIGGLSTLNGNTGNGLPPYIPQTEKEIFEIFTSDNLVKGIDGIQAENFLAQEKRYNDAKGMTKKKPDTIEGDSLEHQMIINMSTDSLMSLYGKEKGLEVIREHLLIEINNARKKINDQPLSIDKKLNEFSQYYAKYINDNNWDSHTDKNGLNTNKRMTKAGIVIPAKNIVQGGEILAKKCSTVKEVFDGRMNSTGHRRNILFIDFSFIGIGYYNDDRVVDFF